MIRILPRRDRGVTRMELADRGIQYDTARLVDARRGIEHSSLNATQHLIEGYEFWGRVVYPTIEVEAKGKRRVRDLSMKQWLNSGSSPIRQLVAEYVQRREAEQMRVSTDSIVSGILQDDRIYSDTPYYRKMIRGTIEKMHDRGQLIRTKGGFWKTGDPLPRGKKVREFEPGFDPVKQEIMEFCERKSQTFGSVFKHLEAMGWVKRRETLRRVYLDELLKSQNLEETAKDWYKRRLSMEEVGAREEKEEEMVSTVGHQ